MQLAFGMHGFVSFLASIPLNVVSFKVAFEIVSFERVSFESDSVVVSLISGGIVVSFSEGEVSFNTGMIVVSFRKVSVVVS